MDEAQKACTHCGELKPLSEFSVLKKADDGLQKQCKACCRVIQKRHRDRAGEAYRRDRAEYMRRWRDANRERLREYYRQYYRDNADSRRAYTQIYFRANPDKNRAHRSRRRLRELGHETTPQDLAFMEILRSDPCSYCGAPTEEIDHIEPVYKGGTNAWENLTSACKSCNRSKKTTDLLSYLLRAKRAQV